MSIIFPQFKVDYIIMSCLLEEYIGTEDDFGSTKG